MVKTIVEVFQSEKTNTCEPLPIDWRTDLLNSMLMKNLFKILG